MVIENVIAEPVQPDKLGVTVINPEIALVLVLVAVNEFMFPVPEAPNPMFVLLLDQLKVAPLVPEKVIEFTVCPSQMVISFT